MIQVHGIKKDFRQNVAGAGLLRTLFGRVPARTVTALSNLSFTVPEGSFYSLLGRNGAGKTTAIKILSTLLLPDAGSASVCGFDVVSHSSDVRMSIGVSVRGERSVYWRLTGRQNLEYLGRLYGLRGKAVSTRAAEVGELLGLTDRLDDYVERYSMGMKQRLAIGCSLVHRPRVLLLDEPTIGLDAASAKSLRHFLAAELRDREKVTILYTTHYMHEAEEMSDIVGILHGGRLVAEGSPEHVTGLASGQASLELKIRGASDGLVESMRGLPGVKSVSEEAQEGLLSLRVLAAGREVPVGAITGLVLGVGSEIVSLSSSRPTLEDAFIALTSDTAAPTAPG